MVKKAILLTFAAVLLVSSITACGSKKSEQDGEPLYSRVLYAEDDTAEDNSDEESDEISESEKKEDSKKEESKEENKEERKKEEKQKKKNTEEKNSDKATSSKRSSKTASTVSAKTSSGSNQKTASSKAASSTSSKNSVSSKTTSSKKTSDNSSRKVSSVFSSSDKDSETSTDSERDSELWYGSDSDDTDTSSEKDINSDTDTSVEINSDTDTDDTDSEQPVEKGSLEASDVVFPLGNAQIFVGQKFSEADEILLGFENKTDDGNTRIYYYKQCTVTASVNEDIDEADVITKITVFPGYVISKGISAGSTAQDVIKAFGEPTSGNGDEYNYILDNTTLKINFYDGVVREISYNSNI